MLSQPEESGKLQWATSVSKEERSSKKDFSDVAEGHDRFDVLKSNLVRRKSIATRSRAGSVTRSNSIFRAPRVRVPKERVLELWKIVRTKFLKKTPDILTLLNNSAPIPYTLSIRQGFQFKYKLNVKHHIRCVSMHPRVPWHHAEGRVEKDGQRKGVENNASDDEKQNEEEDRGDGAGARIRKVIPYTFVCVDHSRTVRIWDVARTATPKPKTIIKVPTDLFHCVFIARYSIIQYNSVTHELVTASSHSITVWLLNGTIHRGIVKIEPVVKFRVETGLPVDEWITGIFVDERNRRIYTIINTKVIVFCSDNGEELSRWLHISFRQITCINHFDLYHYTLLGCTNGSIKVKTMTDSIVHEFNSHTKPITSIAFYPYGPIIITAALDYSVRMYNLKTFKEVYCLHLREKPLSLRVMDDNQLYIVTRNTIMVWALNPINTGFSTINIHVTKLIRFKTPRAPSRVLVRSNDGVIRLLSSVSGKVITTSLPLLETDRVEDLAYCARIDRMFILVENGDIWVIATNVNPCSVVDIWGLPKSAKEDIGCISVFEGEIISEKLHLGGITQMICDSDQQLLITGGEDNAIKISVLHPPYMPNPLTIKVTINTHFVPRLISVLDANICATADDWTVNMYMFNIRRGGIQNRIDVIRYALYLPPGYIKTVELMTWKEKSPETPITFNESFDFRQIYSLKSTLAFESFPQTQFCSNISGHDGQASMNFMEMEKVSRWIRKDFYAGGSLNDPTSSKPTFFREDHVEAWGNNPRKGSKDLAFDHLLDKLSALVERRRMLSQEKKKVIDLDILDCEKTDDRTAREVNLFRQEIEFEARNNPVGLAQRIRCMENADEKFRVHAETRSSLEDILISFIDLSQPTPKASVITLAESDDKDNVFEPAYPQQPAPIEQRISLQEIVDLARAEGKIMVAPDGEIPNSVLFKLVSNWKATHHGFKVLEIALRKNATKKIKPSSAKEDERKKKSDAYKAKLKQMVEEIEKVKEKPENNSDEKTVDEPTDEEPEESDNEIEQIESEYTRRKLPPQVLTNKPVILEPRKDIKYPKIIEQAIVYTWFPKDEIFFPATEMPPSGVASGKANALKREMRKLKIEANGDNIMPIVLECFKLSESAAHRIEMVEYLNWMYEEFGYRDTTSSTRLFCKYLQSNTFSPSSDNEADLKVLIIESLAKYGSSQPEAIPTLVMQLSSPSLRIRESAKIALGQFGGSKAESKVFLDAIQDYTNEAERASILDSISKTGAESKTGKFNLPPYILEYRNTLVSWLRKNLKKFLIRSCRDPEAIRKLKELSEYGRVDRSKKGDNEKGDDDLDKDDEVELKLKLQMKQDVQQPKSKMGRRSSIAPSGRTSRRASVAVPHANRESKVHENMKALTIMEAPTEISGAPNTIEEEKNFSKPQGNDGYNNDPQQEVLDVLAGRNPVLVLQNPSPQDFAAAINYFVVSFERKLAREEQERIEKLARESKAAEEARLENERQMALIEFMKRKEIERQTRINQRKERIAELRSKKNSDALPKIKRVKSAKLFVGHTHRSTCHPSRETLDIALQKFPPLYSHDSYRGYRGTIAVHFQRLAKSMPMENVTILPFEDSTQVDVPADRASGGVGLVHHSFAIQQDANDTLSFKTTRKSGKQPTASRMRIPPKAPQSPKATTKNVNETVQIGNLFKNRDYHASADKFDRKQLDNDRSDSEDYDVSGVLTLKLGQVGTFVINKQPPNKQIWLSSPLSGPKRFDYQNGSWISSKNNEILENILSKELSTSLRQEITLKLKR
ncbi:WD repeat-containing protein 87 [Phlyctochytrium planicorne]|nr:WD repeat-containing protein 87 [Phlyctochytrium planicorne]